MTLAAELDEVRALLRRLREEDAVIREDPDVEALDAGKAGDERLPVELLELLEARAVDDARDELARVDLMAEVLGDQPVQLGGVGDGILGLADVPAWVGLGRVEVADDAARDGERVLIGVRVVVGDAGAARVDVGAAELLCGDVLPGRGLHERRPADEDRPGPAHDHRLVAHGRHVRAAGGARAHHDRDLRDSLRRHLRLVEEDPAEVVTVGKDIGLER